MTKFSDNDVVTLAMGAGGRETGELLDGLVRPAIDNDILAQGHDGARLTFPATEGSSRLAFTTDSYVITPRFFPGGSIGDLAVNGTVNDLAMTGAVARCLSLGLILEEGLPLKELQQIMSDISAAAKKANIKIVTGDTKVVPKGHGDGIYINTAGIGEIITDRFTVGPEKITANLDIILSGSIGDHQATILALRHGIDAPELTSDSQPLNGLMQAVIDAGKIADDGNGVRCLRDATRGGLAAVLNELASAAGVGIVLDNSAIPIKPAVAGICDLLGSDPLAMANEGKCVVFTDPAVTDSVLAAMKSHEAGRDASVIGRTTAKNAGLVAVSTELGALRLVEVPAGELVPRIC